MAPIEVTTVITPLRRTQIAYIGTRYFLMTSRRAQRKVSHVLAPNSTVGFGMLLCAYARLQPARGPPKNCQSGVLHVEFSGSLKAGVLQHRAPLPPPWSRAQNAWYYIL